MKKMYCQINWTQYPV